MKKMIIVSLLLALFSIRPVFGKKVATFEKLYQPEIISLYEDRLFVVEKAFVYVYSMKDFRFLYKFGKRGDGPGELSPQLRYKMQMQVDDLGVMLNCMGKMAFFTHEGQYVSERRVPFIAIQVIQIGDYTAMSKSIFNQAGKNSLAVVYFDSQMELAKTLYSRSYPHHHKSGKIDMVPQVVLIRKYKDNLFVFDQKGDFVVHMFDAKGNLVKKIETEYPKQKLPSEYIAKTWEWASKDIRLRQLSEEMRKMAYFPEYFPVMKNFVVDEGKIYVHTYQTQGDKSEFVIVDFNGKILKKVFLGGADINTIEYAPYTFKDGKYVYLYENPDNEKIELYVENIF